MPAQVLPELQWHPLRYEKDEWHDKRLNITIPKDVHRNTLYRTLVNARCAMKYPNFIRNRAVEWQRCRDSFLYFLNVYGWTFVLIEHTEDRGRIPAKRTHQPFISFPLQDTTAETLIASTGHYGDATESVCIDKSREMGATWLSLFIMVWFLIFHSDRTIMICADREESVDYKGTKTSPSPAAAMTADKDALMGKLDYILGHLPSWMLPPIYRSHMNIVNAANGSRITGSTTREDMARGGRRFLIFVDEAASIRFLKQIDISTSDSTPCRWFNSTPKGAHYFTQLRSSGKLKVVVMGWWDDPRKGHDKSTGEKGRFLTIDPDKNEQVIDGWWRQAEKKRRTTLQDLAENVDIDHLGAGRVVFDLGVLNRHLATWCAPPLYRTLVDYRYEGGTLDAHLRKGNLSAVRFRDAPMGTDDQAVLRLWCELEWDDDNKIYRPPQRQTYAIACDPSPGQGAANTVIAARNLNTGHKVAEFVSGRMGPDDAARLMVALGMWFGGPTGWAYLIWEANGVGGRVGDVLSRRLAYPWLHENAVQGRRFLEAGEDEKIGWVNNPQSKSDAIFAYSAALSTGAFINPSEPAIQEAMRYVRYENKQIGPGELEFETPDAKATHGDRVIADMLLEMAANFAQSTQPKRTKYPPGSFGQLVDEPDPDDLDDDEETDTIL